MTEQEQDRIELFRADLDAVLHWETEVRPHDEEKIMALVTKHFPPPEPKDPIEECRAELEEYMRTHQLGATRATAIHALDIYDKHHPKKET